MSKRIKKLRKEVFQANLALLEKGLVVATFGNVSGIDRESGIVAIKPSGLDYDELSPENMVLVYLDGKIVEGDLNPSSDTKTHLELYRHFEEIGGLVHTHSKFATAWAQARRPLPCLGTTHADLFYGDVPCTELIRDDQIESDYEEETAVQILQTFEHFDYKTIPAVLVAGHGPFTWGTTPVKAVYHSQILEYVAEMSSISLACNPAVKPLKQTLLDKYFLRKHGKNSYYGQKKN